MQNPLHLLLADLTPVAAAAPQFLAADWGSARPARFSSPSVNEGNPAVVAIGAGQIAKVTEGGAPSSDAHLQHLYQGGTQRI